MRLGLFCRNRHGFVSKTRRAAQGGRHVSQTSSEDVSGLQYTAASQLDDTTSTSQGWVFLATRGAVEGGYRLGATTPTPLPGAGGRLETTPLTPLPLWLKKITNVLHN